MEQFGPGARGRGGRLSVTGGREILLGAVMAVVTTSAFAEAPGAAVYKAKCQSCHGPKGMAESTAGREMKVKPVIDPSVIRMTEAEMIDQATNGRGKMPAFKGKLTDAEIKAAVEYFRSFK